MDSLAALNSIPINASQPGQGNEQLLAQRRHRDPHRRRARLFPLQRRAGH